MRRHSNLNIIHHAHHSAYSMCRTSASRLGVARRRRCSSDAESIRIHAWLCGTFESMPGCVLFLLFLLFTCFHAISSFSSFSFIPLHYNASKCTLERCRIHSNSHLGVEAASGRDAESIRIRWSAAESIRIPLSQQQNLHSPYLYRTQKAHVCGSPTLQSPTLQLCERCRLVHWFSSFLRAMPNPFESMPGCDLQLSNSASDAESIRIHAWSLV